MANPIRPPDNSEEALRKVREKMQGYKAPQPEVRPEPESAIETPVVTKQDTEPPPAEIPKAAPKETESSTYEIISPGLMERFSSAAGVEVERYRSRPWRQLPNESPIEYALFGAYLKTPMARGRDLESLAPRLTDPTLSGWYEYVLSTLSVPNYVFDGRNVKKKSKADKAETEVTPQHESQTRLLWWLSEHNYWPERSRLYDTWQLDVLADERRLQIQKFAQEIHKHYVDHAYSMLALLNTAREGLMAGVISNKGQFRKYSEQQQLPPHDAIYDAMGNLTAEANPAFITRTIEWDPNAQLEAMHKISDRLFGPLPNMLDGKVTTALDQSLTLPGKPNGESDGELSDAIPEKRRTNAPWMIERLNKVNAELERKKQIEPAVRPEGAGENEKPVGA